MVRRILAICLVAGLGWPPQLARGQSGTPDADMATGIRQVREGDFDAALITLDGVVKRLSGQQAQAKELARAYTYLAIAYVGLAQQESARAKFLAAWKADRNMTLSPKEFPPNIIQFFEEAKKEGQEKANAETKPVATTPTQAPAPVTAASTPEKKGGGHTGLILLGVGAGAAAIVAVAAAGKGSSTPPTTLTPPPATLADLSATVDSPQASSNISCTDNVFLTVTLRNAARSSVSVSAVRVEHTLLSGNCSLSNPFVLTPLSFSVGPEATGTLLHGALFASAGAGCCRGACSGAFCQFQENVVVVTGAGEVRAGAFAYGETFRGCSVCASSLSQAMSCPSDRP